jgi:CBS domain
MAASKPTVARIVDPLSEGLCVRHIANIGLITCNSTDDPNEVLNRSALAEFDQIPVLDKHHIIGVLDRRTMARRPLDDSVLVSADEPLGRFIFTLKYQPYRLVVDGTAIRGIVTWSDLLKTPVLLFAYSVLAQLELLMNETIRSAYGDDDLWDQKLDLSEQKLINGRRKKLERENLALPTIELADFSHKAKVIRTPFLSHFDFDGDLLELVKLRNRVAHVHKVVRKDADLHGFVEQLETAMEWTKALSGIKQGKRRRNAD